MKPTSERDIFDLLDAFLPSAALSAALQLGLFWECPITAEAAAQRWNIPLRRCQHWLNVLVQWGLLEKEKETYTVSELARTVILGEYSRELWGFIAEREHAYYPIGTELAQHMQQPGSLWDFLGQQEPSDYEQVAQDPQWADRYTRMLYDRTLAVAAQFAEQVDMTNVRRMMDLGGGSGVMSFALLRRYPELTAVVVDHANVCKTGQQLAAANGLAERITFHPANILHDELPAGFDLVLEADVGLYEPQLFRRVHAALNPNGRFVINQPWAHRDGTVPDRLLLRNFRSSLQDPNALECVLDDVRALLHETGFQTVSEWAFGLDDIVLEGRI